MRRRRCAGVGQRGTEQAIGFAAIARRQRGIGPGGEIETGQRSWRGRGAGRARQGDRRGRNYWGPRCHRGRRFRRIGAGTGQRHCRNYRRWCCPCLRLSGAFPARRRLRERRDHSPEPRRWARAFARVTGGGGQRRARRHRGAETPFHPRQPRREPAHRQHQQQRQRAERLPRRPICDGDRACHAGVGVGKRCAVLSQPSAVPCRTAAE